MGNKSIKVNFQSLPFFFCSFLLSDNKLNVFRSCPKGYNTLFVQNAHPVHFVVYPVARNRQQKLLPFNIESNAGKVDKNLCCDTDAIILDIQRETSLNAFELVSRGVFTENQRSALAKRCHLPVLEVSYIWDCIKQNKLLSMDNYRLVVNWENQESPIQPPATIAIAPEVVGVSDDVEMTETDTEPDELSMEIDSISPSTSFSSDAPLATSPPSAPIPVVPLVPLSPHAIPLVSDKLDIIQARIRTAEASLNRQKLLQEQQTQLRQPLPLQKPVAPTESSSPFFSPLVSPVVSRVTNPSPDTSVLGRDYQVFRWYIDPKQKKERTTPSKSSSLSFVDQTPVAILNSNSNSNISKSRVYHDYSQPTPPAPPLPLSQPWFQPVPVMVPSLILNQCDLDAALGLIMLEHQAHR